MSEYVDRQGNVWIAETRSRQLRRHAWVGGLMAGWLTAAAILLVIPLAGI